MLAPARVCTSTGCFSCTDATASKVMPMTGFDVNTYSLAQKIGQLRAMSDAVLAAAGALELPGGDLGPGDIGAAVQELADAWRDGIEETGTRIDEMAGHVSDALDNYEAAEQSGYDAFVQKTCPTLPQGARP